jgi:hypothetical protein
VNLPRPKSYQRLASKLHAISVTKQVTTQGHVARVNPKREVLWRKAKRQVPIYYRTDENLTIAYVVN